MLRLTVRPTVKQWSMAIVLYHTVTVTEDMSRGQANVASVNNIVSFYYILNCFYQPAQGVLMFILFRHYK